MFDLATVSRPYALAVFRYADENNQLDNWADFLAVLAQFNNSCADLVSYFESFNSQADLLTDSLIEKLKLQNTVMIAFLKVLQQAKRLSCINEINNQFLELKRQRQGIQKVSVQSAFELNQDQIKYLQDHLKQNLKKDVEINIEINPKLIGGFMIKINDFVYDYSIQAKLNHLKNQLL